METVNDLKIITSIVQRGNGERIVKAALKAGAQGATVYYGRGTGVREKLGLMGSLLTPEKEIIIVITRINETDAVFRAVVEAGELDKAGKGFAYIQQVEQAIGFLEE